MSIKVLVADDSITIQKVIGIIFGGDEYSLTVVDNGKAAIDKAFEITPDILLIDALMPGMSGYEVCETVRSTPSLSAKPILILTGSFEPFDEEKAIRSGADDFIAKPFESQQIINKVKELLELGRSRAQSVQGSQSTDTLSNQMPEISATLSDTPTPLFAGQPAAPQPSAPSDIWGAFTTEVEPTVETAAVPDIAVQSAQPAAVNEPDIDVFAIVGEENDAQLVAQAVMSGDTSTLNVGSQWTPVEESTFEFADEVIAKPSQTSFSEQSVPAQDASFGDITFEDEVVTPAAPVNSAVAEQNDAAPAFDFADLYTPPSTTEQAPDYEETFTYEEPPAFETEPFIETATSAEPLPAPSLNLTEEQLRSAITAASKDVIERIVWEVVPDLAEAMIREAIRKIKEGN